MNRSALIKSIRDKQSFLCVGLDTDLNKIPSHLLQTEDPIFEFNKAIIDATHPYAVAYKPNLAFYEALGIKGLTALQKTMVYLRSLNVFTIADAKRGDIGNTSAQYAKAFLDPEGDFNFNALTVAPYMGKDSVSPFFAYPDKWVILLALTSNTGAADFQFMREGNQQLFQRVIEKSQNWGSPENLMFVVGATHPDQLRLIRQQVPNHFLLVPGIGAQGGNLDEVAKAALNADCGLLVNASRSILYAASNLAFADAAAKEAQSLQSQMATHLRNL